MNAMIKLLSEGANFPYLDHIWHFPRSSDNCRFWQVIRKFKEPLGLGADSKKRVFHPIRLSPQQIIFTFSFDCEIRKLTGKSFLSSFFSKTAQTAG
jgi:hypothetical protein